MSNYAGFVKRLERSRPAMFRVAEWFHEKDYYIAIPPIKIRGPDDDPKYFFDGGDMFITKDDQPRKRVEVKGLSATFTSALDWPYGDPFVSNKPAVDRANGDVSAYICLSATQNHIMIIPYDTHEHWYVVERTPKTTGKKEQFYCCPLQYVIFKDITRKKEP